MSVLGPLRAFVISFAATQCHASLTLSRGEKPLGKPVSAFVDVSQEGPCACDSFCTGVRAATAQQFPSRPVPAPPQNGAWSPSGMMAGMDAPPPPPYGFAPDGSSSPPMGMRQRSGRLSGQSLVSLASRPRSEAQREALLHGASAALLQLQELHQGSDAEQYRVEDGQPLGPRREPGMHCNCHCNHDPWSYMRGTAPPIDWSMTPAPPTVLPAPAPCSGTGQEWPGCKAPMRVGLHIPLGGLPGLPKLLPVEASDLPTLGPAPGNWDPSDGLDRPTDVTAPPPGPPPEPQRPAPAPPDPAPGSPPAVPEFTAAGPVMDCFGPKGPIVCPPDPANVNGWWGKPRDAEDIYYNSYGADANFQDALTGR